MKALEHIDLLGMKVRDKATGFTGVVTTVSFDLYSCIQALVQPEVNSEGNLPQSAWFDVNRFMVVGKCDMDKPSFDHQDISNGDQGCAEKPAR